MLIIMFSAASRRACRSRLVQELIVVLRSVELSSTRLQYMLDVCLHPASLTLESRLHAVVPASIASTTSSLHRLLRHSQCTVKRLVTANEPARMHKDAPLNTRHLIQLRISNALPRIREVLPIIET